MSIIESGIQRRELVCVEPAKPPRLAVRSVALPQAGNGEVLVRVLATSVNPIDAKRATGYGQRLLGLMGAAHFPLVLGNDLVGIIESVGPGVTRFARGEHVYGLVGTGRAGGAHASHLVVPQNLLLSMPKEAEPEALALLPYSFTTMWLALRATGIHAGNARGKRVLIHGANGGLGRLALQVLHPWGCEITAICGTGQRQVALDLGAQEAFVYEPTCISQLPNNFDVVLNFANWDDDAILASRLGLQAMGQATTVHPLLSHFDQLGWVRGAWASYRDKRRVQAVVVSHAPRAHYSWTIFKPDSDALAALAEGVRARRLALPLGIAAPFDAASAAFEHVSAGKYGRAVLLP